MQEYFSDTLNATNKAAARKTTRDHSADVLRGCGGAGPCDPAQGRTNCCGFFPANEAAKDGFLTSAVLALIMDRACRRSILATASGPLRDCTGSGGWQCGAAPHRGSKGETVGVRS